MTISASGGSQSAEFGAWQAKLVKAAFKGLDTDGDGSVSQSEFQAAMQKLPAGPPGPASPAATGATSATGPSDAITQAFKALDGNGDGQVSQSEVSNALAARGHHHHHARLASANGSDTPPTAPGGLLAAQLFGQAHSALPASANQGAVPVNPAARGNAGGFDLMDFLQEQFLAGDPDTANAAAPANGNASAGSQPASTQAASGLVSTEQARQMLMRYAFTQVAAPNQQALGVVA